jgi:hypothetical protein
MTDRPDLTWGERAVLDESLAAWRDAEVARAHVELQALRIEYEHGGAVIARLQRKLATLRADRKARR